MEFHLLDRFQHMAPPAGGDVLKMLITGFAVFTLPYIAMALIAKISYFGDELRDFLQS